MSTSSKILGILTVALALCILAATGVHVAGSPSAKHFFSPDALHTCSSSGPCQEYSNAGSGPGVQAESTAGDGIVGETFATPSPGVSPGFAGVHGVDMSPVFTSNAGVIGTSTNGVGVRGVSTASYGVQGVAGGQSGVYGFSSLYRGVYGFSEGDNGAVGETTYQFGFGVVGLSDGSNGWGVEGTGDGGVLANGSSTTVPALEINSSNGGPLIIGIHGSTHEMSLDASGNMILRGGLTQHGTPLIAGGTNGGPPVVSYGSRTTSPEIEDIGAGQLVDGEAYVRLDDRFRSSIDPNTNYFVFLTPQGPTRGELYVTQKSLNGFAVRENQNGQSNVEFDYRVVAKPYGDNEPRLPLVTTSSALMRFYGTASMPRPVLKKPRHT